MGDFEAAVGAPLTNIENLGGLGKVYAAGTGNQALTAAGNLRMIFTNPAGSGIVAHVFKLSVLATASGFGQLLVNPTTGLPVAARTVNATKVGSPAGLCTVAADTNLTTALAGGTDTGIALGVPANAHADILADLPRFIVPAGVTLGINVPFSGAANASITAYWWEQ